MIFVIDNWHLTDDETSESIVLNVCDDLVTSDGQSVKCPAGAAICLISESVFVSVGSCCVKRKKICLDII